MQTSTWPALSSDALQKFQKCQANRDASRQPFGDMMNCESLCHQATVEQQVQSPIKLTSVSLVVHCAASPPIDDRLGKGWP